MAMHMPEEPRGDQPAPTSFLKRHWASLSLAVILLSVLCVRVRLCDMPLERDEGEYAYAGQLILQGVPPYTLAYNMKLPGTYAAYALMMAVFGQTAAGVHLGFALVNLACIALVFLIARTLLDDIAAVVAALVYALMSTSSGVLGLAAHATHFVVVCALVGAWFLWQAHVTARERDFFLAGLFSGLAFVMKQHGIFFCLFASGYALWRFASAGRRRPDNAWKNLLWLGIGLVLPFVLTCLLMLALGVFKPFWFWTVSYASEYATAISVTMLHDILTYMARVSVVENLSFWILAAAGAVVMWWEKRFAKAMPFLIGLLIAGIAALLTGLQLRHHYFVLALPALALLNGVMISRAIHLIRHDKSIELFLALTAMVVCAAGVAGSLVNNGRVWFGLTPQQASVEIFGGSLFSSARELGEFIRKETPDPARLAVLGSEPEIYFHSRRRSATGYIYTYPLMEKQKFAAQMQEEMIREIESSRPEYVVYVSDQMSWLRRQESNERIFDWWERYRSAHYDVLRTVPIHEPKPTAEGGQDGETRQRGYLMLMERKKEP
jgi:4-amino-4-deoxy-L-arabinose transferase-like glycosyltransferase